MQNSHLVAVIRNCFLCLVVLSSAGGCSTSFAEARISDRFTDREIEEVLSGVEMWCDADVACLPARVVAHEDANIAPGLSAEHLNGSAVNGKIEVNVENTVEQWGTLTITVAHEIGHLLSAKHGHPDCSDCIMGSPRHGVSVTEKDVAWIIPSRDSANQ